jgi:hypothetical protein
MSGSRGPFALKGFIAGSLVDHHNLRRGISWCWHKLIRRHVLLSRGWFGQSFRRCWGRGGWLILYGEVSGDLCVRGRFLWRGFSRKLFGSWGLDRNCSYIGLWCRGWSIRNWRFSRSFFGWRSLSYMLFDKGWLFHSSWCFNRSRLFDRRGLFGSCLNRCLFQYFL